MIGNIHVQCQFKDPMGGDVDCLPGQAGRVGVATDQLVFCWDFNSQPGQAGYSCFTGTQIYDEVSVDPDRIPADTFSSVVTSEQWKAPFLAGCTCYGLTAAKVETKKTTDHDEDATVFEPRPFHLDHCFVRDPDSLLTITSSICPTLEQVRAKTSDDPLLNLDAGEQSNHLPIELGFRRS